NSWVNDWRIDILTLVSLLDTYAHHHTGCITGHVGRAIWASGTAQCNPELFFVQHIRHRPPFLGWQPLRPRQINTDNGVFTRSERKRHMIHHNNLLSLRTVNKAIHYTLNF